MLISFDLRAALAVSLVAAAWVVGAQLERPVKPAMPAVDIALEEPSGIESRMTIRQLPPRVIEESLGGSIAASGTCVRPTVHEQNELHRRIATWIDQTNAHETPDAAAMLELQFGCYENGSIFVIASADRSVAGKAVIGRWWVLRVGDKIETVAKVTGMPVTDWMEWAQEASIEPLGLVDLDGDGLHDLAFVEESREGGAMHADDEFWVATAKRVRRISSRWTAIEDVTLEPRRVVLMLRGDAAEAKRYCLDAAKMLTCAR